jgi:hypothetical protein
MNRFFQKEDGQVIVLVAIMMTVLLGMTALVIDGGGLYLEKLRIQKVVDAAALAGAQELPQSNEKALQQVDETIIKNKGNTNYYSTSFNSTLTSIEVTGRKEITLVFAKAIGIDNPTIEASARVELSPLVSGVEAIPLGIEASTKLVYGERRTLKFSDANYGNFGALALSGPGAKDYETDLKYGYEFQIKVNDVLDTRTGNIKGPTKSAVDYRTGLCQNATYDNFPTNCARVVLVPVYEAINTGTAKLNQVKVVGFATFFLEGAISTSEGDEVTGRFIRATRGGGVSNTQIDYGTYGYKLVK